MKKVLSIVLSLVMVICMMPVMAFAADEATGTSFTDASSIEHSEAVYSLAALNIINGYTDGTYKPAKTVTRAEMAKLIATLLNGGTEPVLSTTTTSFTDTKGHWAAGYIEYCNSLGIVAGVGGGRFSPDATVTAEQAAKMLLIAQGYNADVEGLVGASWAANTNVLANQNGYYKELADIATGAGLVREHAAQMIYNVLDAKVIVKTNSIDKTTGKVTTTYAPGANDVAEEYLKLQNKSGELKKITYNEKDAVYTYSVDYTVTPPEKVVLFESAVNYTELFGQNVKVLYKTVKGKTVVYGMYADDSSVVATGVFGDIDAAKIADKKIKIDDQEYKTDGTTLTYAAEFDSAAAAPAAKYVTIKAIDNDNDGDIDVITYAPVEIGQITFVGKTQFNVTVGGTSKAVTTEDVIAYDGMAKDDFVAIAHDVKTDKDVYTKLDTVKDVKVASTKGDTATVDGTAYDNTEVAIGTPVVAGNEYDAIATLNGYIVAVKGDTTKADITKYAVVTGAKEVADYDNTYKAKILKSDGTEAEVTVSKVDNTKVSNVSAVKALVGQMVTFKVSDEKYELTTAKTTPAETGFDVAAASGTFTKKTTDDPAKIGISGTAYGINDDAVVFVKTTKDGKDVYSVIKGSDLAAKTTATVTNVYADENVSTGYTKVTMVYINGAESETTTYAYAKDNSVKNVADGKTTYSLELSTGDFVTIEDLTAAESILKGDIVSYTLNEDNKIKNITTVGTAAAVTAYDGTNITIAGTIYKFTDKATIIYVDSDKKTVAEGGTIALADKKLVGGVETLINNVKYETKLEDGKTKIDLLVVDVNNEMK